MGMRANSWYSPDLNLWRTDPHGEGKLQLSKFSPQSKNLRPHTGLPCQGILHQKEESPEYLAFKGSRAYV